MSSPRFTLGPLGPQTKQALSTFGQHAMQVLQEKTLDDQVPYITEQVAVFAESEPTWTTEYRRRREARRIPFVALEFNKMLESTEVKNAVQVLWEEGHLPQRQLFDNDGNRLTDLSLEAYLPQLGSMVMDAVFEFLNEYGTFNFDEEQFIGMFRQEQNKWAATEIHLLARAPLKHFQYSGPPITFIDGTTIEPLTAAEKTLLWHDDYLAQGFTIDELASCRFQLKMELHQPLSSGRSESKARISFNRALTAMRLLGPGSPSAPAIVLVDNPTPVVGGVSSSTELLATTQISFLNTQTYQLDDGEVTALIDLHTDLTRLEEASGKHFALALRRFNMAHERLAPEDVVIDLTIALESSLLFGVEDELTYKLGLRGAALLRHLHVPNNIQPILTNMYKIRSAVVHNGKSLSEVKPSLFSGIAVHEYPTVIQGYVQQILREYVKQLSDITGNTLEHINQKLDEQILQGLSGSST